MRRAFVLLALCGCRQIFGLHGLEGDDGVNDAGVITGLEIVEGGSAGWSGTTTGGTTESGVIEADVHVTGGLHATGFEKVGVGSGVDLDTLDLGTPTGDAYGVAGIQGDVLGVNISSSTFSIVFDGEIFLDRGSSQLQVDAKGAAAVEIDVDGVITRFDASDSSGGALAAISTARDDWYPIRGAFSTDGFLPTLDFQLAPPGGVMGALSPSRLRARTTERRGLHAILAQGVELQDPSSTALVANLDGTGLALEGLASTRSSARFEGQLLVDTDGSYSFDAVGRGIDHARVFVDNRLAVDRWHVDVPAVTALTLTAGWHDLVVDYGHVNAPPGLELTVDGADVAADHLRPKSPVETVTGQADCGVGPACALVFLGPRPSGEVVDADVAVVFTGARPLDLKLQHGGTEVDEPLATSPNETSDPANPFDYFPGSGAGVGSAVLDDWTLAPSPGASMKATLMVRTRLGTGQPLASTVTYTSKAFELVPGRRLVSRAITVVPSTKATLQFAVRTADSPAALDSESFTILDDGDELALGTFVQYQLVVRGDGWTSTLVTGVELGLQ